MRLLALTVLSFTLLHGVEHPFLLWTADEAAALRQRIASDADAQAQLERMAGSAISKGNPTLWNLFRYAVLEDQKAGDRELNALLSFIGRKPEPLTWDKDPRDFQWNVGNSSPGDAHMRDEQTLNVLRYDVFHDRLTPEQRAGIEQSFRSYIAFHLDGHPPTHPQFKYSRAGWLPNMHWPRAIGTHLMAVALRDEEAIAAMFNAAGGWKWYFDDYLTDGRFYMEEFGKYYSNVGTMLLYCEALERLGLSQYGYGYTGSGGATMRRYIAMLPDIGLPRLASPPGSTPDYPRVTMGDAGSLHNLIDGLGIPYTRRNKKGELQQHQTTGPRWWSDAHMNGPLPKMHQPLWWEFAHRRWPEDGYDYFLAQFREPGAERYLPSLYCGLTPIVVAEAAAHAPPTPSYVARERGFALLRMEEGPAYWESPRPALAQQFAMYYVHYVHDCFALLQYVAHNRMIYCKMGREPKGKGYAGGDGWLDHGRGHCTVVVDGTQAKPVDNGENGTAKERIRDHLGGDARFVACQAIGIYPDVTQERLLVLTDQYLLDLFHLVSDRERQYDWQVISGGLAQLPADAGWQALDQDPERPLLVAPRRREADGDWAVDLLLPDVGDSQGVGVRVRMLPEAGTGLIVAQPPSTEEGAGTSLLVVRRAAATLFAALHEPFSGGACPERQLSVIARSDTSIALRIVGSGCDDRICLAWGDAAGQELELGDDAERFRFTDFAFVRISDGQTSASGTLAGCRLAGATGLAVGGEAVPATVADGVLEWGTIGE